MVGPVELQVRLGKGLNLEAIAVDGKQPEILSISLYTNISFLWYIDIVTDRRLRLEVGQSI